jgi:hypothetical protein
MARRFSDDPVNLIQILPSKGKVATPNPFRPSFSRFTLETGATVVRSLAHALTLWSKSLRVVIVDLGHRVQDLRQRIDRRVAWTATSLQRARRWFTRTAGEAKGWGTRTWHEMRTPVYPPVPVMTISSRTIRGLVPSIQRASPEVTSELDQLHAQVATQGQELYRLTSQVMELKALTMSQEQVLLCLGKELDAMHMPIMRVEAVTPKKMASRSKKPAKIKRMASSRAAQKPSATL